MTEDRKHQLDELSVTNILSYLGARASDMEESIRRDKLKWHNLHKDPTDLPDNSRYVWTNAGAGYHDDDGWWDSYGRLSGVIAWCEPKFKGEEQYVLPKDILGLWEQTICEIRGEIKSWDLIGPHTEQYATELCDKLEHSMCALAGGHYKLRYDIEED